MMRPALLLASAFLVAASISIRSQPYAIVTIAGLARTGGNIDGTNSTARFTALAGAALDGAGNLYLTDGDAVRSVVAAGTNWVTSTLAGTVNLHGTDDGTNGDAQFNYPQGLAADASGNLYLADTLNNEVRRLAAFGTNWVSSTLAGAGPLSPGSSDGINGAAQFYQPYGIAVDSTGVLYVADTGNHLIRKIVASGPNWVVTTLAGNSSLPGNVDGTNSGAQFESPAGIAADTDGRLYVTDFGADTIRVMTPVGTNWVVTTLAGTAGLAGNTDGPGSSALFKQPLGIAIDGNHHIFVADSGNNTLRKITLTGLVTTIAGAPGVKGNTDGIGMAARFRTPQGLAASSNGTLYVADYLNYTVRRGQVAPLLQIASHGNQVVVFWPVGLTGYLPQSCGYLGAQWGTISNGFAATGDYFYLTNSVAPGDQFYRLYKPTP